MLRNNQKGTVSPAIIVALVLVIALGGFIVWRMTSEDEEPSNSDIVYPTQDQYANTETDGSEEVVYSNFEVKDSPLGSQGKCETGEVVLSPIGRIRIEAIECSGLEEALNIGRVVFGKTEGSVFDILEPSNPGQGEEVELQNGVIAYKYVAYKDEQGQDETKHKNKYVIYTVKSGDDEFYAVYKTLDSGSDSDYDFDNFEKTVKENWIITE